jgi:hypothetical protein
MIRGAIQQQFGRRLALLERDRRAKYWEAGRGYDPKHFAAIRDLLAERNRLMAEFVADDGTGTAGLDGIPADKRMLVGNVLSDYSMLRREIIADTAATSLAIDRASVANLEWQQHQDLMGILTAEQLEQYELQNSETAAKLRTLLAGLRPTEEEFKAAFRAVRPGELERSRLGSPIGTPALSDDFVKQFGAQFGDERVARLQAAMEPQRMMLDRIALRLNLTPEAADAAFTAQQSALAQIRGLGRVQPNERIEKLRAIHSSVEQQMTSALGPSGFETYKDNGGTWIRHMEAEISGKR